MAGVQTLECKFGAVLVVRMEGCGWGMSGPSFPEGCSQIEVADRTFLLTN